MGDLTRRGPASVLLLLLAWLAALAGPATAQYCSQRPGGCCPGRDDECTAPIENTLCYCDAFCLRSRDPDCCPDVYNNCSALADPSTTRRPPQTTPAALTKGCRTAERHYAPGDSFRVNCNICTCLPTFSGYQLDCSSDVCLIRDDVINEVNLGNHGWSARNYSFLWGLTLDQGIERRLGTFEPRTAVAAMKEIEIEQTTTLPDGFDSRQKWPGWIEGAPDQGDCGSSWAVSTTAVASDRLAIQSMGKMDRTLSAQHLLSCNAKGQRGCQGGHLDRAWFFMRRYGVVTDMCYPYRSGKDEPDKMMNKLPCSIPKYQSSPCPAAGVTSGRYRMSPPYRIAAKEEDIKAELFTNGPLQATMVVKEDFYVYGGGVYQSTRGPSKGGDADKRVGYHSVRILGWGVDRTADPYRPVPYWLCANSWGDQWGEGGYFRILRGQNECEIESFVLGVWGDVDLDAAPY